MRKANKINLKQEAMKNLIIIILLLFGIKSFGQESFKKKYSIQVQFGENIHLLKDTIVMYNNMNKKEKEEKEKIYEGIDFIEINTDEMINGKKVTIIKSIKVDSIFKTRLSTIRKIKVTDQKIKGFVKFEDDGKIIINRYLKKDSVGNYTRYPLHYYQLENRQSINLCFQEFTVSALTLPFKYRMKGKNNALKEDFNTAINGNVFIGYSFAKTSFFYQEKVGNKSNTWKITPGLLLGASSVVLDKNNTNLSNSPIIDDSKFTKGLGSIAFGLTFSFNKINFGAFYGSDYASSKWNYNKKPWLGIAIGYSILNF